MRTAADPSMSPVLALDCGRARVPADGDPHHGLRLFGVQGGGAGGKAEGDGVEVVNWRFEDVGHGFEGIPTRDQKQRVLN